LSPWPSRPRPLLRAREIAAPLLVALLAPSTATAQEPPPAATGAPAASSAPAAPTGSAPPAATAPPATTAPPVATAAPEPPRGEGPPPPAAPATAPVLAPPTQLPGGFSFGSYGRVIASSDLRGQPGRDSNIVAHGSRLDEDNYVELELRRDDTWKKTDSSTRLVATLAIESPLFQYSGNFTINMAVRNLYMEERDLAVRGLSFWAGSRMYRGDDIYLLDWWPLDNLNTFGAGARYEITKDTAVQLHGGVQQPANPFYQESVERPLPYNELGSAQVNILNRQAFIGSAKLAHLVPLGMDGAGLKFVAYSEVHALPGGQEQIVPGIYQPLTPDNGLVIGAQVGAYTGKRDTHLNLFVRYATGIAAYADDADPTETGLDQSTDGAHELVVALGGNWEDGPFGVMFGGYVRSFRNPGPSLNFDDVDEGIVIARPAVFFGEMGGLALEGSYQVQQRGVLTENTSGEGLSINPSGPLTAKVFRFGIIPFLSPAGRGDYSRPQFRVIYAVSVRNQAAMSLYPTDDPFSTRNVEHFLGVGAEWWFNSTSYGG
jgi:hypothetical protein